ncbi:LptF/LptG family permease [Escherichia coli]
MLVVLMTLPRTWSNFRRLSRYWVVLLELGQLSKNGELTAIRSTGFSIFRIALVALVAGILWTVCRSAR